MIGLIENGVQYLWIGFGILWILAAVISKRTVQVQSSGSRLLQSGIMLAGLLVMFNFRHWLVSGWLMVRLMPETAPVVVGGGLLTVAGLLLCVWARVVLGSNWSGTVTIKQDHQLIMRGPYQIVRHPIYTGLLLALLGTSFVVGFSRCFVGLLIVGFGFWLKLQTEEQFMLQQFGAQYTHYRQQVRALIPFVL
jgi:protein-S-isoprenylcysteine O-methyltransferase